MIKQDIHIYVAYSRPNDWTEWAEISCGHPWVFQAKQNAKFIPRATPGPFIASTLYTILLNTIINHTTE